MLRGDNLCGKIAAQRLFYFIAVFLARRGRATEKDGAVYHNARRYGILRP